MSKLSSTIHFHNPDDIAPARRTYIIYYITGNPGLIEYYREFLTHLYGLLQANYSSSRDIDFQIFGRSLNGFETVDDDSRKGQSQDASPPFDVKQQIAFSIDALKGVVHKAKSRGSGDVRVILMGHSLGTYICMEVMRQLREEKQGRDDGVRVVGAVLLFATIMDLAKSPSGLKSSYLLSLPLIRHILSLLAHTLCTLFPTSFLTLIICKLLNQPPSAAHITTSFLASPHGVEQALYLAHDEMTEIGADKWDDEIWGAAHESSRPRPVLRFLFAGSDHWVANSTRDALIKARGYTPSETWKPVMEVDEEEGWPHGFCINHSIPVAKRVFGYVGDIVGQDGNVESI